MSRRATPAGRAFWATITLLIGVTLVLVLVQSAQLRRAERAAAHEIDHPRLVALLQESARTAETEASVAIDRLLDSVYAPVHAAIPGYADFHYSVIGEYTELTQAALGRMDEALEDRLFAGFETRMNEAVSEIDKQYALSFAMALDQGLTADQPPGLIPTGPLTQAALDDAMVRVRISAPLAGLAAGAVGSGALKVIAKGIAKKLGAKLSAKAAAKAGAKGGGVLAGAGGGAALCAWAGPGAAVCGVVGGVAAWVLADSALVRLDEVLNRQDFEAELHALVDQDRALRSAALNQALTDKVLSLADLETGSGAISLRDLGRAPNSATAEALD